MIRDLRAKAAKFYDLNPHCPDDIRFYQERASGKTVSVLELGCGTGRVTLPLSRTCEFVQGIDNSEAMLSICRSKLLQNKISQSKVRVNHGDISNFALDRKFDLIIAPYRTFQNLETDEEIDGLFRCIRDHLAVNGRGILNVFKPRFADRATLIREWPNPEEALDWLVVEGETTITCHHKKTRLDPKKLILYPDLIYRVRQGQTLSDEVVLNLVMRCYFPEDFENLIRNKGFDIMARWGSYSGEPYGAGPDLIIEFR